MRLGREYQRHYTIDGEPGWTLQQVMDELPGARYDAIGKRLRRGVRSWAELRLPARPSRRPRRAKVELQPEALLPCPFAPVFAAWTHTTRGRALQQLDVNVDPLRASL